VSDVAQSIRQVLARARHDALASGRDIFELLGERTDRGLASTLETPVEVTGAWILPAGAVPDDSAAVRMDVLPLSAARALGCVAVAVDSLSAGVAVLMADPWDERSVRKVTRALARPAPVALSTTKRIADLLAAANAGARAAERLDVTAVSGEDASTSHVISIEQIEGTSNPVVRFVDAMLHDGWQAKASDIHFEMTRAGIIAKFRLDGVLVEASRFEDAARAAEVISRLKVLASLDVAETRIPQDGRFRARINERGLDFRVSIMPSSVGEDAVLRLLDKSHLRGARAEITLESLGFGLDMQRRLLEVAARPHGMLLVTGPTGSGKTTTLYALLAQTRSQGEKVVTIEDPVEYELEGVLQVPVNERKGLTFAKGLRSILRHDPDRILVGEIRDAETGEIAVQAALTGHQVYTTVHANNAFDVISRFIHLHVDLFGFASSINAVLAQRLVRLNCRYCSAPTEPSSPEHADARKWISNSPAIELRQGRGCSHCRGTGFLGRTVVAELLPFSDRFRELIAQRAPLRELKALAQTLSSKPLREVALALVASGQTTIREVERVVALAEES
jgi:general secretion pathway protein E